MWIIFTDACQQTDITFPDTVWQEPGKPDTPKVATSMNIGWSFWSLTARRRSGTRCATISAPRLQVRGPKGCREQLVEGAFGAVRRVAHADDGRGGPKLADHPG